MHKKQLIIAVLVLFAAGAVAVVVAPKGVKTDENINTPVTLQSSTEKGATDLIRVTSPKPNDTVMSPLTTRGEARGNWYFEATFPVKLFDVNGNLIAQHYAQAQGEWMTTEYVPFSSTLTFAAPTTATGTLVLENDNPSGLPEHDDQIRIPVRFGPNGGTSARACRKTGCSGQVCSDDDVISTCEFRPEYACYRTATCARQTDGGCGWTLTSSLTACLKNPPAK